MLRAIFFILVSLALTSGELSAVPTLPGLSGGITATPSPSPTPKPFPEQLQDAQQLIKEAEATLKDMQSTETINALSAAGLPPTMQTELVAVASNGLRHSQRYLEHLRALERTQKIVEARQALQEANQPSEKQDRGLVRDRVEAAQQALESATSEVKNLTANTQDAVDALFKLDQAIQQPEKTPADKWQITLAKLKKKDKEAVVLSNVTRKQVLALRIAALEKDVAADQNLLQADPVETTTQAGAAAIDGLDKEKASIKRQLADAKKRDQAAQATLDKLLESYLKSRAAGDDIEATSLRQKYELAQAEAETAEEIIKASQIYLQISDIETAQWQYFAKLEKHISTEEVRKQTEILNSQLALVRKWKPQFEQEVRSKQVAVEGIKRRVAEGKLSDKERLFFNNKLKLLQEQTNVQQQLLWRIEGLQRQLADWLNQLEKAAPSPIFRTNLKQIWSGVHSTFLGIINYEVVHYKETRMIAGNQVVVEERSITVARIVVAFVIFCLGYFLLTKLAEYIGQITRARFQLPIARTALLEKCILYLLTVILVLFTLVWARIPLTIFAYLGGALAIGIGFGAQNLINNFISGIILLFEQQINVGDIVEIDGNIGEVMVLGNRCSRVRRGDGVEMLVPNSFLLEKNVLNWTLTDEEHRFEFKLSVNYGSSVEKVIKLVERAFSETANILTKPSPVVFFEEFADSSLIFGAYYWVKLYKGLDARQIGSNLRARIAQLFADEGIQMPFPQRDIHLDANKPLRVQIDAPGQ